MDKAEAEATSGNKKASARSVQQKRDTVLRRYIPELAKARKFADPGSR